MQVINLIGPPGSGKSTNAALLFGVMKQNGYKVELVTEYAKEMIYENRYNILEDQLYILAKQARRIKRLENQVDYVITDSPLLLTPIYNTSFLSINTLALDIFYQYNNKVFYVERRKTYQQYGRIQNQQEAIEIDFKIINLLQELEIDFKKVKNYKDIYKDILI